MFKKASKQKRKLRAALFGASGSGKTYSALAMASGLGGKIAVIDTERGSAHLYADKFSFDAADLYDRSVDGYIAAITEARKEGYDILIIDSLTHAWHKLLEEIEQLARTRFNGNTWSAWSVGTPKQRKLVDVILDFPGHVIVTMRSKTEWIIEKNARGKNEPTQVGLSPEQGKGIEYEFDLLFELNNEHGARVTKDRSGLLQDQFIERPGVETGMTLKNWLEDGSLSPHEIIEAAVKNSSLSDKGIETMIKQFTNGNGTLILHIPTRYLEHIPTILSDPQRIERLNNGRHSATGELIEDESTPPVMLGTGQPTQPAVAPSEAPPAEAAEPVQQDPPAASKAPQQKSKPTHVSLSVPPRIKQAEPATVDELKAKIMAMTDPEDLLATADMPGLKPEYQTLIAKRLDEINPQQSGGAQ